MIWLGLAAIACTAIHDANHLYHGRWWDLLWACHLAAAVIGVGCLADWPACVGIGLLWLVVGAPLWIVGISLGERFLLTSMLTHLGGLAIGLIYVCLRGMPAGAWWQAILVLIVLQQVCRWVTPPQANVNLAFSVNKAVQKWFTSYPRYWLALKMISVALYLIAEYSLRYWCGTAASRW